MVSVLQAIDEIACFLGSISGSETCGLWLVNESDLRQAVQAGFFVACIKFVPLCWHMLRWSVGGLHSIDKGVRACFAAFPGGLLVAGVRECMLAWQ